MSRRPTRRGGCHSAGASIVRGGGHSAGSLFSHREIDVAPSFANNRTDGPTTSRTEAGMARASEPNLDEFDRALAQIINAGGADGGRPILNSTSPPGSHVSSCSGPNSRGTYKGLNLEKGNKARGDRLEVEITSETGRPSVREQALALASEMGLACRECLPLYGDWRNIDVNVKKYAFERMNARLKLINLDDVYTYDCHLRHMALIRRRWRWRVRQEFLLNGDDARPAHISDADWTSIKQYWQGLDDQRERHLSDPTHEQRSLSEIGETARSHVVNLHCTGPVAHTTLRFELERELERSIGVIEMFERTRRKDVITQDRPDGWLLGTKATHEKFVQARDEGITSGRAQTDEEIVDAVMKADKRSDYRPGLGYGPRVVGRSSKRPCSKQHYRDELVASQKKNERLEAKLDMLFEEMAQIKAMLSTRAHDTSTNTGHPPPLQHVSGRNDDIDNDMSRS